MPRDHPRSPHDPKPTRVERHHTCSKDCWGGCCFTTTWERGDGEETLVAVTPAREHPYTRGFVCRKLQRRAALVTHPARLTTPLERDRPQPGHPKVPHPQSEFHALPDARAWEVAGARLRAILAESGPRALLAASYAGNVGFFACHYPHRLWRRLGCRVTTGSICNAGGKAGLRALFGTHSITNPLQVLAPETRFLVVWGRNLSEMDVHGYHLLKQARRQGVQLAVVDPRGTRVARDADLHVRPRPGSDALVAAGLVKILYARGAEDREYLARHVLGAGAIRGESQRVPWETIRASTGLPRETFEEFAGLLATHRHHTLFDVGAGVQKYEHGGATVRSLALVQVVLGNVGKPGTGILYSQGDFRADAYQHVASFARGGPVGPAARQVDLLALADALAPGRADPVRALVAYNFNPASSLPDQATFRAALARDDLFVVVVDQFFTETAAYADLIFPAKLEMESADPPRCRNSDSPPLRGSCGNHGPPDRAKRLGFPPPWPRSGVWRRACHVNAWRIARRARFRP